MWIVPWNPFLMKKLLKSVVCETHEQNTEIQFTREKSKKLLLKKKKKKFWNANYTFQWVNLQLLFNSCLWMNGWIQCSWVLMHVQVTWLGLLRAAYAFFIFRILVPDPTLHRPKSTKVCLIQIMSRLEIILLWFLMKFFLRFSPCPWENFWPIL